MQVPASEIPDMTRIREWVAEKLPSHYQLREVKCWYGTDIPGSVPEDWEIAIEYVNTLDESMHGSPADIDAYHSWADPLIAEIRAEGPASTVRIGFKERLLESE